MSKLALVTGASRGIGRAIALQLAKDGYEVIVHCAANMQKAEETCALIRNAGGMAYPVKADLTTPEGVQALCTEAAKVDALILNASVQIKKEFAQITPDDCHTQIFCNFAASLMLIQAALPHMQAQKWGRIVTIGSVQEKKPHPQMVVYSASKAAQTNMALSLATQVAKDGITVNNVAPGVIYTDRNREALADEAYAKAVSDSIPAGFYGKPEDCAGMVSLLCSDAARYITGQSIFVDGGKGL